MGKQAEVMALLADAGPTVSVPLAGRCLGVSRATAYELAGVGRLGVPVLRVGSRLKVPTAELRRVLMIDPADPEGGAA